MRSFGFCFGIVWCWRSTSCFRLLASLPYMSIKRGDKAAFRRFAFLHVAVLDADGQTIVQKGIVFPVGNTAVQFGHVGKHPDRSVLAHNTVNNGIAIGIAEIGQHLFRVLQVAGKHHMTDNNTGFHQSGVFIVYGCAGLAYHFRKRGGSRFPVVRCSGVFFGKSVGLVFELRQLNVTQTG